MPSSLSGAGLECPTSWVQTGRRRQSLQCLWQYQHPCSWEQSLCASSSSGGRACQSSSATAKRWNVELPSWGISSLSPYASAASGLCYQVGSFLLWSLDSGLDTRGSLQVHVRKIPVCFLSGVAVGAGWQVRVAIINVGCYYLVGIPMGILLGFKLKHGTMVNWNQVKKGRFPVYSVLTTICCLISWSSVHIHLFVEMFNFAGHMDGHVVRHVSPNVNTSRHYLHNKVG